HADAGPAGLSRTLPEQRRAVGVHRAGLTARVDGRMHAHHAVAGVLRAGVVVLAVGVAVAAVGLDLADASLGGVAEDHDAEVRIRRAVERLSDTRSAAALGRVVRADVVADAAVPLVGRGVTAVRRRRALVGRIARTGVVVIAVAVHQAA